ncbi:MAG: hypothetical protein GY952_03720 [Rhodobacteraceae bacterium]|nr:hypothetical protein [Paracoccaceae bacterium]
MLQSDLLAMAKRATTLDLFLISFFLLPFIAREWLGVMVELGWQGREQYLGLAVLLGAYLACLWLIARRNRAERDAETLKDMIVSYLKGRDFTMMSFDRVRKKFNAEHDDDALEGLIARFPGELRHAKIISDKGTPEEKKLPGVARLVVEGKGA